MQGGLPLQQPRTNARNKNRFLKEYTEEFVDRWDEYVDWDARDRSEGSFFPDVLAAHDAKHVLDIACGTGFHAVKLKDAGFDVEASDGSPNMVEKARENAARFGHDDLDVRVANWLQLSDVFDSGAYDAVACLGNSFTHLQTEADQRKALEEMREVLRPGGVLVIDQRNYDKMLDKGVDPGHSYYYAGKGVDGVPVEVNEERVRFKCVYEDGDAFEMTLKPVRQAHLAGLLEDTGFELVDRYGDFRGEFGKYDPDFVINVARKD